LPTDRPAVAADYTLTSFFDAYYLPVCLNEAAKETVYLYRKALTKWRLLTGDPVLTLIDNQLMARVRDTLIGSIAKGRNRIMSPHTVRMYLRMLQAIIDKAGPPGPKRRDAAGILSISPWCKPPRAELKKVGIVAEKTLSDCYTAAVAMTNPRIDGFKPAAWWRALLVVTYNTGLRSRTLFSLRMEHIKWQARVIDIPAKFLKGRRDIALPISEIVYSHLVAIRTDRELVFPWPYSMESFRKTFHKLQNEAGIPPVLHFGLHALRRTAGTLLWQIDPAAAQLMLAHSSLSITKDHYVNAQTVLAGVAEKMPQPAAFGKGGAA
jgi:integrase